jgi:hypothetical protein
MAFGESEFTEIFLMFVLISFIDDHLTSFIPTHDGREFTFIHMSLKTFKGELVGTSTINVVAFDFQVIDVIL